MPAADPGADADHILRPRFKLWFNQYRPRVHRAQVFQRGVEGGESLLITGCRIADDVTVADSVVGQLAPQRQIDHRTVEPEAPNAFHARLDVEYQVDAVPQRIADGGCHRIIHP